METDKKTILNSSTQKIDQRLSLENREVLQNITIDWNNWWRSPHFYIIERKVCLNTNIWITCIKKIEKYNKNKGKHPTSLPSMSIASNHKFGHSKQICYCMSHRLLGRYFFYLGYQLMIKTITKLTNDVT